MQGRVVRPYTLGFGPGHHVLGKRNYNERAFVSMDHAIDAARRYGIRLMIPLFNHFWSNDALYGAHSYGNFGQFTAFYNKPASQFYVDREMVEDQKHLISFMLNRINTVNGIRYGDDPTVFCWELGNELGGWTESPPPGAWTVELARHIKSLAPNALVADGTLGGLDAPNRFQRAALESSAVDLFSCHYYWGGSDIPRISRDANFVAGYNKVFFIGEYGLNTVNHYKAILDESDKNLNVAGKRLTLKVNYDRNIDLVS